MPGQGQQAKTVHPPHQKQGCSLFCARAIVTMRAHCHRNEGVDGLRNWENLKRGQPVQTRLARELHQQADVPEGPCGIEELHKFQSFLGPRYQLLVMCRSRPFFLLFKGPPADLQIRLLKLEHHYDGRTSFPAFVNRSYWCVDCEKGFDHDDAKNHPCEGRTCKSCSRKDCPEYALSKSPHVWCDRCNGRFYGPSCFSHHLDKKICQRIKTCPRCQAEYSVVKGKPHRCGYAKCPCCQTFQDIRTHRCFIQPVEDDPPEDSSSMEDPTEEPSDSQQAPPFEPLFVYADIEAMQMPDRTFRANLLCYRHSEDSTIHSLKGSDCCVQFLRDLDELTEVPEDDRERPVIIIFHNLKGFDGMFLMEELYLQQREVENQLTVGAKVLSFKSGPLTFKDSLCFLPMPLSAFTATFNLRELNKEYFPHEVNTPDHQDYVGPIPALKYYDLDGMQPKKKKALEEWYAEQVRNNVVFDFAKELEEYC